MPDRSKTEVILSVLLSEARAVTDDQDRLLTKMAKEGAGVDLGFVMASIREERAALIAAMQTARIGLSVAAQNDG